MKLYQTALAVVRSRGPERKSLAEVINSASTLTLCPLSLLLQSSFVIKSTICPVQEINSVVTKVLMKLSSFSVSTGWYDIKGHCRVTGCRDSSRKYTALS